MKERVFWGVFLILGAIFIIAGKLGYMQGIPVWSLIWTVVFAATLVKSLVHLNYVGIFLSLALLANVYSEQLQIQSITPWPVLGAGLLLGIGFSMIFPKKKWKKFVKYGPGNNNFSYNEHVINETDGSNCKCGVNFGSSVKYINSDEFESANLEASFGGMKVYFDNAVMKNNEANLYINCSFGGMELYIPRTWKVDNHMTGCFGGAEVKGRCEWDGIHILHINGDSNFGGVTIIYV